MSPRILGPLLAALLLTGCSVGPDYQPPTPNLPDRWSETAPTGVRGDDLAQWWHAFHDPELDRLIDAAIAGNLDLKMAVQRTVIAKTERDRREARDLPVIGAGIAAANSRASETLTWPPGDGEYKTYQYGLDASWELDVFGGNKRSVQEADALTDASVEDRKAVLVSLLGEVAADYATLRSAQVRLDIANRNIAVQQHALELSQRAFQAGLGTDLDVARAQAEVETSQAQVPHLEAVIARMCHALSVLTGRFPGELTTELTDGSAKMLPLPELPTALPSDVVRNRPDIRRAERRIAAATARVGVAEADLFPHFQIPLGLGPMTSNLVNLFDPASLVWTFGLAAGQTLYDGGARQDRIKAAQALTEEQKLAYEQTILAAFREVEDRLNGYATEGRRQSSLIKASADQERAVDRATKLYARGLVDFLKVLDSERALYRAQDTQAESELAQRLELIGLYRALGGGWQSDQTAMASSPP